MANKSPTRQPAKEPTDQPPPRVGVFVCDCGDKVAGILDIEALVEASGGMPGVVYANHAPYWCSTDGRERLSASIRANELERVVVAGCSPRTHLRLFQETAASTGLNPDLIGLINVREGCAWPHRGQPKAAVARARDQIGMEVAHMAAVTARPPVQAQISPSAVVIGGGVAGMTAALELAEAGVSVTLIERAEALGGQAVTDNAPLARELVAATQAQPAITIHLSSHISQVDGSVGAYHLTVTDHVSRAPALRAGAGVTQHGPFGAIIVATGAPDGAPNELANLLRLPQDTQGFLPESRVRLRPGNYIERGIFVCGSVHYPCDAVEAQFQAYSAASRVLRHLRRGSVAAHGPVAQVDLEKCNGCGDCLHVCPFSAVTMVARHDETRPALSVTLGDAGAKPVQGLSLSIIDPLLCTGCGNCVSICPVGAVTVAGWTDAQLEAQMDIALGRAREYGEAGEWEKGDPRILIFACEWSGYAAAELAGAQKLTYPPNVRLIRLDCSGRLQPGLILKAFEMGAAGVLVLGCAPRLCHYERGNERAAATYEQVEAITGMLGLPSTRLRLAWTPPDDGPAFSHLVTEFVEGVMKEVGSVE